MKMNIQGVTFERQTPEETLQLLTKDWEAKTCYYGTMKNRFLRREAENLEEMLVGRGYGFAGISMLSEHNGLTVSYQKHKKLTFKPIMMLRLEFWFDDQGGLGYTVGELSSFFNPFPNDKYLSPKFFPSTVDIVKRFWPHFEQIELNMIQAVTSQAVISRDDYDGAPPRVLPRK